MTLQGPADGSGSSSSARVTPLSRLLLTASQSIASRTFFPVTSLNPQNLERLKFREAVPASARNVKLGNGLVICDREDADDKKFENVVDWDLWHSGFLKWIELLAQSPLASLVADRMAWLATDMADQRGT